MPRDARKINIGDTAISKGNWDQLAGNANRMNRFNTDAGMVGFNDNANGVQIRNKLKRPDLQHEIRRRGSQALYFTSGVFEQNGTAIELKDLSASNPGGWDANSSYLVFLKVQSSTGKDPELNMTDVDSCFIKLPLPSGNNPEANQKNRLFRLGRFQTGGPDSSGKVRIIKTIQDWKGGAIERFRNIADADSYLSASVKLNTINQRPVDDAHTNELQLYNAQKVSSSTYAFPFLDRGGPTGDLEWMIPDADKRPHVNTSDPFGSSQGHLKSIAKDRVPGSSVTSLQLWGFRQNQDTSLPADSRFIMRHPTGLHPETTSGEVVYPNRSQVLDLLGPNIRITTSQVIRSSDSPVDSSTGSSGIDGDLDTYVHGALDYVALRTRATPVLGRNANHDLRYRFAMAIGSSGVTGFGRDDKSYETSGRDGARKLYITDSSTGNNWSSSRFNTSVSGKAIIRSFSNTGFGDITLSAEGSAGNISIFAQAGATGSVEIATAAIHSLVIGGDHLIDGATAIDDLSIHHGHITQKMASQGPVAGGLAGVLASLNAFYADLKLKGFMVSP